jgi:hypothetical protein
LLRVPFDRRKPDHPFPGSSYGFDALVKMRAENRDAEALCSIDESYLQSGSSELKNWIAAAGVLFETSLQGDVVGYQPCYGSEAGTGTANGFVCWR